MKKLIFLVAFVLTGCATENNVLYQRDLRMQSAPQDCEMRAISQTHFDFVCRDAM